MPQETCCQAAPARGRDGGKEVCKLHESVQ